MVPALKGGGGGGGGGGLHDIDGKQDPVYVRLSCFELKFKFQSHSKLQ